MQQRHKSSLTVCVTGAGAGVGNVWEQVFVQILKTLLHDFPTRNLNYTNLYDLCKTKALS
jgi:hypothetical protein